MSANSQTFFAGPTPRSKEVVYLQTKQGYKAVISFLQLVKITGLSTNLTLTMNIGGREVYMLPVNYESSSDVYILNILEEGQTVTLDKGDFISAKSNNAGDFDSIISGELEKVPVA